jgi:hypothetical protein
MVVRLDRIDSLTAAAPFLLWDGGWQGASKLMQRITILGATGSIGQSTLQC